MAFIDCQKQQTTLRVLLLYKTIVLTVFLSRFSEDAPNSVFVELPLEQLQLFVPVRVIC